MAWGGERGETKGVRSIKSVPWSVGGDEAKVRRQSSLLYILYGRGDE
jgi:hypothetical protein